MIKNKMWKSLRRWETTRTAWDTSPNATAGEVIEALKIVDPGTPLYVGGGMMCLVDLHLRTKESLSG
jgi:hypothetical protein